MKREDIVHALLMRITSISQANGYATDIGNHVAVWQDIPENESDLPFVNIYDRDSTITELASGSVWQHDCAVEIGIIASGDTSMQEIRAMVHDLYRAIKTDPSFGGLIDAFIPQNDEIDRDDDITGFAYALIKVIVRYRTGNFES